MRVLLIEDDAMVGASLVQALRNAGMTSDWVRDGAEGEVAMTVGGHALILLDLGLPQKSGLELLRELRRRGDRTPLIIITSGRVPTKNTRIVP